MNTDRFRMPMAAYLEAVRHRGFIPPFNLSAAYLSRFGVHFADSEDVLAIWDEEEKNLLFPAYSVKEQRFFRFNETNEYCWTNIHGDLDTTGKAFFNDFDFIYDPKKMESFICSTPCQCPQSHNELGHWPLRKDFVRWDKKTRYDQILNLVEKWCDQFDQKTILFDIQTMMKYINDLCEGKNVDFGLKAFTVQDNLVGLVIWDMNFCHVNMRYLIYSGTRDLAAYMFKIACSQPWIAKRGLLINAGGDFGQEALRKWKESFNPIAVYQRYSTGAEESNNEEVSHD